MVKRVCCSISKVHCLKGSGSQALKACLKRQIFTFILIEGSESEFLMKVGAALAKAQES